MPFLITPNVKVTRDEKGAVRLLLHIQEPYTSEAARLARPTPQELAAAYVRDVAEIYHIAPISLNAISEKVGAEPRDEGNMLRFAEEKSMLDTMVVGYVQTNLGLPVWQAGFTARMNRSPSGNWRVNSSQSSLNPGVKVKKPKARARFLPSSTAIESLFQELAPKARGKFIRVTGTRLLIYRYEPAARQPSEQGKTTPSSQLVPGPEPMLPLPPVPETIRPGTYFVVSEVLFAMFIPRWGEINWRAFVEVETGAILYLRAFIAEVSGDVFFVDPLTKTGNNTITPCSAAGILDPLRDTVSLQNLTPPPMGNPQALSGQYVQVLNSNNPNVAPPTSMGNFIYSAVTDDFSAVSAYFQVDTLFGLVQSLGFPIANYFDGTTFPVPVYFHLSNVVNAHGNPNATGTGIGSFDFGLAQAGCPVGIVTDKRIVIHEFCHGVLEDNIHSPYLGFSHNGGDAMAAILSDPGSQAPDRGLTFPWAGSTVVTRRHDRPVATGWAWGGTMDVGGYSSEEILATTFFRLYQSTDGDSIYLIQQTFASMYVAFLYFQAVASFDTDPVTPTNTPDVFANAMMTADTTAIILGIPGGGLQKVIRWSFEKQGLYQPVGAPTPVTTAGAPPDVDVYIDDGRNGEYSYLADFYFTQDVWNRRASDGGLTHEEPIAGVTNFAYVRVKNRGTQTANNVVVYGYHTRAGTGGTWPDDFQAMTTDHVAAMGAIPSGGSTIVGPFSWTPILGHDCLLMSVSATGDMSNIDPASTLPCKTGPIPGYRLIPYDNNIVQRNVYPIAGGGGLTGLADDFDGLQVWVLNPFDRTAPVDVLPELPNFLATKGWEVRLLNPGGSRFTLGPRASKEVVLSLKVGEDFSPSEVELAGKDARIVIRTVVDGVLVGGMIFPMDPKKKGPVKKIPSPCVGEVYEGKISAILYDCYGDFEGFVLDLCPGKRMFSSREKAIEDLVRRACSERTRVSVQTSRDDDSRLQRVTLNCE